MSPHPHDDSLPADRPASSLRDSAPHTEPIAQSAAPEPSPSRLRGERWFRISTLTLGLLLILLAAGLLFARYQVNREMHQNLPQLDGSLSVFGLHAPVTVQRDARGVPHIRASSLDDLVFAQGFITAQDRLWQMDLLRRHASGELAAVFGRSMLAHDRLQRILQIRTAADSATAALPADQKRWLEIYARGVNASMIQQRDHLPVEFRVFGYKPTPWTPRDSILVELAMTQDLTTGFPEKLGRESLSAHLPPQLIADLYPTGSWRDHPPGSPIPDVTAPQPEIKDIPLDESQSRLRRPAPAAGVPARDLLALRQTLALFHPCQACASGSNGWAIAGSRTVSGKPMLSNDMHLSLSVPDTWYEADLEASSPAPMAEFHAAGLTLPGLPFIIAGHNAHVSWGFTNLGADVQDLYIEHTRGTPSGAEYQTPGGDWLPVRYRTELIQVRDGASDALSVPIVRHGNANTPIITSIFPGEKRSVSLRWTIYDPATVTDPLFAVDTATDWPSMLSAMANWGGPPENLMYADDQGHIAYHAVGRVPIRGDINNPSPISPLPIDAAGPGAAAQEWAGYIPFDQLPQALDPADGVLATANARVTPNGYRFPITLNWMAPYRTERVYKVLESGSFTSPIASGASPNSPRPLLSATDMLALQNDVFSEADQVLAQRFAYAIDHTAGPLKNDKRLHQAADLLRDWNGHVDANAAAPAIVNAARTAFWPLLLIPRLVPQIAPQLAQGVELNKLHLSPANAQLSNLWTAYTWGERDSVAENLITDTPARWLPPGYANWNDFFARAVAAGLRDAHAPSDLSTWQQGKAFPLDIVHPIFSRSKFLEWLISVPTGTGPQSQSGDRTTVKQVGQSFGPSERFTADLSDPDRTTLNLVLGQSGNPVSPWYRDQFQHWLHGRTYPLPFTPAVTQPTITHTLTLTPR